MSGKGKQRGRSRRQKVDPATSKPRQGVTDAELVLDRAHAARGQPLLDADTRGVMRRWRERQRKR